MDVVPYTHRSISEATIAINQAISTLAISQPRIRTNYRTGFAISGLQQCLRLMTSDTSPWPEHSEAQMTESIRGDQLLFAQQQLERCLDVLAQHTDSVSHDIAAMIQRIHAELLELHSELSGSSTACHPEEAFAQQISKAVHH